MRRFRIIILFLTVLTGSPMFGTTPRKANAFKVSVAIQTQQQVHGKVLDEKTGKPISFCNISLDSSPLGTASNELGEFVITVDSFPAKLIFSHLNYGQQIVEVAQTSVVSISMTPLTTNLEEVVISAAKEDAFAMNLVRKAFEKAQKGAARDKYGRAFYRQKTKNGDNYAEFSEIFYDVRYSSAGIEDWNILEGRYALNDEAVFNRNFTILSRILKPLQPDTDELIFPLHPELNRYYKITTIRTIEADKGSIAIIRFDPLEHISTPVFEAEVYIDTDTADILKISGVLARDDLKLARLATKNSHWRNYKISYEIAYKLDGTAQSILDYINVGQVFDYYRNDSLQFHTATTSNLTFFEHYKPSSRKKLGGRAGGRQSDWEKLDQIGYNKEFWADNPIIKRTPVEEEVISAFEKHKAFGSIFLNSSDHIGLMTSDISEDHFIKELSSKASFHNNYNPIEKVFLHSDKDLLSDSEDLWYAAYVVTGPYHRFSDASRVVHVDLIAPDGTIIVSQTRELINGKCSGNLRLPKELLAGNYQLRAYTQWMRNFDAAFFYAKTLKFVDSEAEIETAHIVADEIDLQFFPEGGHAVAGLASKIAFKAIGVDGLDRDIKGEVIDSKGNSISVLSTLDRGAGFFQLIPKEGEQYKVILNEGKSYPFPKVLDKGYSLTVNNLNENSIKVSVRASEPLRARPFYIVGHMHQRKYYQGKFEFGERPSINFEIPKSQMPSGVLTLTLFDTDKKPWCERAVFVNNQEELVISTKINDRNLVKRGKIALNMNVTDTNGQPVSASLSLAVSDVRQVSKNPGSSNILSQLLLESEIKGHIDSPGLLFKNRDRAAVGHLDLIMMTHAWRKFNWPEIWKEKQTQKNFPFSKGLRISGVAFDTDNKPLENINLNIIAKSKDDVAMYSTKTSNGGKFQVDDFNLNDSVQLVFNAYNAKQKPLDLKIELDEQKISLPPSQFITPLAKKLEENQNYIEFSSVRVNMDSLYSSAKITELKEVTVTADKSKKQGVGTPSIYGITPNVTLYPDDHRPLIDIFQLLNRIPGVRVTGSGMNRGISIRSGSNPLWVVDNIPYLVERQSTPNVDVSVGSSLDPEPQSGLVSGNANIPSNPIPNFIQSLDVNSIERIEVLKDGTAAFVSALNGQSGVIMIYTKVPSETRMKKVLSPSLKIYGHTDTREFYSPKYDVVKEEHRAPDYRATLYWNPSVVTDENGNAQVEFFNSDTAKEIQVSIEGLSPYGIPGTYLETFGY